MSECKEQFYKNKINEANGSIAKTWRFINECSGKNSFNTIIDGNDETNHSSIANEFIKYFINSANFGGASQHITTTQRNNHNFSFQEINVENMTRTILELPNKQSTGHDGIQSRVLKDSIEVLSLVLTVLFNKMVTTGEYPIDLKIQKVTPIHKTRNKYDVQNYRPIAVLPIINKCFEKILHQQVTNYLNEIRYKLQYGFRSGFFLSSY